jgi:hypothetical protein
MSLNNLGSLLQAQGDLAGARPYYERALAICEDRLSTAHPMTRTIRANLAALDSVQQNREQQIAEIAQHAEEAVVSALAESDVETQAVLAEQLEARA